VYDLFSSSDSKNSRDNSRNNGDINFSACDEDYTPVESYNYCSSIERVSQGDW